MIWKYLLAASAFSPVVILTGVRVGAPAVSAAVIGVGLAMAAGLLAVLRRGRRRSATEPLRVLAVSDRGIDAAAYLPTFLLPFLVVNDPAVRDLVVLGLFAVLLVYVSAQTDLLALNPWLFVTGRRLVQATVDRGDGLSEAVLLICSVAPVPASQGTDGSHVVRLVGSRLYLSEAV
ncbi:MAG: hypothetical protein JWM31_2470 [Solirubrobacterales bacterium]|nr:hypothetical protein [Solirubrobacterales bacterium]